MTEFRPTAEQLRSLNEELMLFIQKKLGELGREISLANIVISLQEMGFNHPSFAVSNRKKIGYFKFSQELPEAWEPDYRKESGLMIGAGKFFRKTFFSGLNDQELKELVEEWQDTVNESISSDESLSFTESSDIHWAYHEDNYARPGNSSRLWDSCMKGEECQSRMDFYTENGVEVLMLVDQDDVIYGRALLWRGIKCSRFQSPVTFVDRIYTYSRDYDYVFLEYIREHGYVTKEKFWSRDDPDDLMIWGENDWHCFRSRLEWGVSHSSLEFAEDNECPFLDTMFNWDLNDNTLSNSDRYTGDAVLTLNQTNGSTDPDIRDFLRSEDGEFIHESDVVNTGFGVFHREDPCVVEIGDEFFHEDELITCAYSGEHVPDIYAIFVESLGDYVNEVYTRYDSLHDIPEVDEYMVFSELYGMYISQHFVQKYRTPFDDLFYIASEHEQNWDELTDLNQSGDTRYIPINCDGSMTITDDGQINNVDEVCLYNGVIQLVEEVDEVKPQFDFAPFAKLQELQEVA